MIFLLFGSSSMAGSSARRFGQSHSIFNNLSSSVRGTRSLPRNALHAKHACCLLDGVSQSFGRGGRFFWFRDGFHTSSFHEIFLSAVNCVGLSETGKSN